MKKILFSLLLSAVLVPLCAKGLKHDFSRNNTAKQWTMIQWGPYKPYPKIVHNREKGFLHIYDVRGKGGFGLANHVTKVRAMSPDTIRVRFTAKGKGYLSVGLQYFSRGRFTGCDSAVRSTLTPEWKEYELELPVRDIKGILTDRAMLTFAGPHNGEVYLKNFSAVREKSRYAGNLFLPKKWTVFPLVKESFVPDSKLLTSIPATFGNVKGKEVEMLSNTLDFARITGKSGARNCSWAFAELESPLSNYECTFGIGADWWMSFYVNGKEVLSTMRKGGNVKETISMDNHLVNVKLKKGRNILAVKFLSGSTSSIFTMGGPKDLRNIVRGVKLTEWIVSDDYDNDKPRKNLYKRIQGIPAPGLMTLTGQGVYRAADTKEKVIFSSHIAKEKFVMKKDHFFAMQLRVQSFGTDKLRPGALSYRLAKGKQKFEVKITHDPLQKNLSCLFLDGGKLVKSFLLPANKLPADLLFAFQEEGSFLFNANSLADSSRSALSGHARGLKAFAKGRFSAQIALEKSSDKMAEILVDELIIAHGKPSVSSSAIPYMIDHKRTFDPVKEKWPLVFSDDFNGNKVDESKWIIRNNKSSASVKNGLLHIKADYGTGKKKDKLVTCSLWSRQAFQYGYFEARLRFTRQPGWWAAFWLYQMVNANPFMDGFEIDIFEDYYNRPKRLGNSKHGVLDHNLHVNCGSVLKSWNYNSRLPGTLDDFYVLACKWTPFEISYYLNGKLISSSAAHSPYDSVTYDAFYHAAGAVPLQVVLSGCIMSKSWQASWGHPSEGKFPEYFLVDRVRVYGYPQKDLPSVAWKGKLPDPFQKRGSVLKFSAEVKPSPKSKAPIKAVYLFDNGYMIAYKEKAPYTFEVPFTEAFYKTTRYTKSGRSGRKVPFDGYPHAYKLFVQDVNGKIAQTENYYVIPFVKQSSPYKGKPIPVPGVIRQADYDEGGQNIAYYDTSKGNLVSSKVRAKEDVDTNGTYSGHNHSGEWRNYTIHAAKSGNYLARLNYGTPLPGNHYVLLLVDGKIAGKFLQKNHEDPNDWKCASYAELPLKLTKGIHKLTMLIKGGCNLGALEITGQKR